jgi:Disulphide bond corrector protein DsbC
MCNFNFKTFMKYFLLLSILICNFVNAQVKWTHSEVSTSTSTTSNQIVITIHKIVFTANIQPDWHIYAQQQYYNFVGTATKIEVVGGEISGISEKGNIEHVYIKQLGISNWQFQNKVVYTVWFFSRQKDVTIKITYQTCTDEQCFPETIKEFKINL